MQVRCPFRAIGEGISAAWKGWLSTACQRTDCARTEDGYLLPLRRGLRDHVLITVDTRGGAPPTLVERAIAAKQETQRDAARGRGRAYDEVWCTSDRDIHPNVPEVLDLAGRNGVDVVMSNPCIELWFVLHFEDQTAAIDRHPAQRRSAELLGCEKNLTVGADQVSHRRRGCVEARLGCRRAAGARSSSQLTGGVAVRSRSFSYA